MEGVGVNTMEKALQSFPKLSEIQHKIHGSRQTAFDDVTPALGSGCLDVIEAPSIDIHIAASWEYSETSRVTWSRHCLIIVRDRWGYRRKERASQSVLQYLAKCSVILIIDLIDPEMWEYTWYSNRFQKRFIWQVIEID